MPQYNFPEVKDALLNLLDTYDKQRSVTVFNAFSQNFFSFHGPKGKVRSKNLRELVNGAQDANDLLCTVSRFVHNTMLKDNSSTLMKGAASILFNAFDKVHDSDEGPSLHPSVHLPAAALVTDKNAWQLWKLRKIFEETMPMPMSAMSAS